MTPDGLRPIEKLLYPPLVTAENLHAVGTLRGKPWHSSMSVCVAGPPPEGGKPEVQDYDFGSWVDDHEWMPATPDGWIWQEAADDQERKPIVFFAEEWQYENSVSNMVNGRYFRGAVRLGAVSWERRKDGRVVIARNASGEPVAMIATMRR